MERGYFKIWRKIEDSQSYNRSALHRAILLTIFVKANWKEGYFCGQKIMPGQIATSVAHFAEELREPRTNVQRALREIEKDGVIKIENVGNKWTMVTIVNWGCYQQVQKECGQPMGDQWATTGRPLVNQWSTSGLPVGTIKEGKNININTPSECLSDSTLSDHIPPEGKSKKNPVINLDIEEEGENPCPHKAIISAYHKILPEMPQVRIWRSNNAVALRTRWKEKLHEGKFTDRTSGIAYFERFFAYVRESDWLMGKKTGRDGRAFHCSLQWMIKAENFDNIIAGKYHDNRELAA